jgi:aminoglycoside phosphotransferase (APT) family kinase protein
MAYERLREKGVPAPEVITLDLSKSLAPYDYIILSKMAGEPLIDCWQDFSPQERERVGRAVGRYLAMMHECPFTGFGALKNLPEDGFKSWHDDMADFLKRHGEEATANHSIDAGIVERMQAILARHRPLLEMGAQGRLVHGDYQFENVLVQDDVTAILDFEWARSGDPAWDFRLEDQWEEECPGSRALLYEGYTSYRPLDPDHALRVRLYKLWQELDNVIFFAEDQPDAEWYRRSVERLLALVAWFEDRQSM